MTSRPFIFDTEFDAAGGVVRASDFRPIKRAYTPAEVEALVAQARLEGRETALSENAALQAQALSVIAEGVARSAGTLMSVAQAHREGSAEIALSAARVIAGAALERSPDLPLRAALEQLGQEIDASPRLVIRAPGLDETSRDALKAVAADAGFSGLVAFRDDAGLPMAAFQLEWSDGRADFDPAEAAARVAEALTAALAAEAGHAESLTDPLSKGHTDGH